MINASLNRLRDSWSALSARDRQMVKLGAFAVTVVLFWLLIVLPLDREAKRLRTATPEAQAQLARMRVQAATIQPLRGRSRTTPAPGTLVSVVDRSATSLGLRRQISKLEADGSRGVQISADGVAFNSLIAWVSDLRDAYGLQVDSAEFTAHTVPGTVNARLRLRIEGP